MADQQTTQEQPASRTEDEIVREAKRIEESVLYSCKAHFVAAQFWSTFHLWNGVPILVLSLGASAYTLSQFPKFNLVGGISAIVVAALSGIMTFLNPQEKASAHLNAGNRYDSLQNKARIFWTIDCRQEESERILTERLKDLSDQKDRLNQSCVQFSTWAYKKAKKGIEAGESEYKVDKLPL